LWFLGVLCGVLRRAEGEGGVLSSVALAGGVVFAALTSAGFAAEILYPATLVRFEGYDQADGLAFASLALATWLYHYCQVGASVMITATSLLALMTGVLPRWLALAGLVVALLTLLHFLLPLLGALAGLAWIAVVSALMLSGGVRRNGAAHPSRAQLEASPIGDASVRPGVRPTGPSTRTRRRPVSSSPRRRTS
jgi:hypothetical protein